MVVTSAGESVGFSPGIVGKSVVGKGVVEARASSSKAYSALTFGLIHEGHKYHVVQYHVEREIARYIANTATWYWATTSRGHTNSEEEPPVR